LLLLLPLRQETMVGNKSIGGGEHRWWEDCVLSPFVVVGIGCQRNSRQFHSTNNA
jgi:hypothetical protein